MRLSKDAFSNALEKFAQNTVWTLIIAPVGGIVLAFLKAHQETYTVPVLYGFAGCLLILGIGAFTRYLASSTVTGHHRILPQNAAIAIRNLIDRLGLQVQNFPTDGLLMCAGSA
jgi:hypothetical protein